MEPLPDRARVAIVGGGIAGASIAYHLSIAGCTDVVVLDSADLVGGTTAHAPGLVGQLRSSASLTRMLMYSVSLYRKLSDEGTLGFLPVGSLRLASSPERMQELRRQEGFARTVGLEAHLLGPDEAVRRFPPMNRAGVEGALYLPHDGSASATVLARAMIALAERSGVRFFGHTELHGIASPASRIQSIHTSRGSIKVQTLILATGIWSHLLGRRLGINLPLQPVEHQYITVGPVATLGDAVLPNLRDPDSLVYVRQDGSNWVLGGYERNPQPYGNSEILAGAGATIRPFDFERFDGLRRALLHRVPAVHDAPTVLQVNGLESFTPDGEFLLGPVPEITGVWTACGFCAHGVSGAGGVGKVMAEWILGGEPELDLWYMDIRRFGAYAAGGRYVGSRACEIYSTYYDIGYPGSERLSARPLRTSPMYDQLALLGASFGEKAGWERPNWFDSNAGSGFVSYTPRGWAARDWSPAIEIEHRATRERVALFDVSSFAKLEVAGPDALRCLNYLTDNQMDRPVGSVTYTQMLNERGGIECDLTVTRLAADRFMLVTGTAFGVHDLAWIRSHLPVNAAVTARDITSTLCCVGIWGPRSRDILQSLTDDDVGGEAFPYLTARPLTLAEVPVLALRVTYVGELGWEIYAPPEYGRRLWRMLWEAGNPFGMVAAGYRAVESLRLEKGYRYWSTDINGEYNPYEAGLQFAVRLKKGPFLGRDACIRAKQEGLSRKLSCLVLDDPQAIAFGGEPILDAGATVGRVTSGGYGYTVRSSIAYGYIPVERSAPGTALSVLHFGEPVPATVRAEPLYDPLHERVKEVGIAIG